MGALLQNNSVIRTVDGTLRWNVEAQGRARTAAPDRPQDKRGLLPLVRSSGRGI